jgi:ASCH domain-containing protein
MHAREQKALSVRQPWASMIVWGLKTVEVRSWSTEYRGELYIHAAKRIDERAAELFELNDLPLGCLLGSVQLAGVDAFTPGLWTELADEHLQVGPYQSGLYAWRMTDPQLFAEPIPYLGERGVFRVSLHESSIPFVGR